MSTGKFRMNEGDWVCEDAQCGNVNFARRTSCNRCGKEKTECPKKKKLGTEIGKAAAEKSGGLFSADDWQCSKCGNVNWARRQQCNMCNAPKFGEVEERTGYGGGYNERENVEYIKREDSDGEYDEFGRKKKKFRDIEPKKGSPEVEPKEVEKSHPKEEEEEEDDDDEDGDLSKYDLSGWGDDSDNENDSNSNDGNSEKKKDTLTNPTVSKSVSSGARNRSRSNSPSPKSGNLSGGKHSKRSRSRSRSSSYDSGSRKRRSRSSSSSKSRDRCRSKSRSRSRSPARKHR